jgi:hypothetical protein
MTIAEHTNDVVAKRILNKLPLEHHIGAILEEAARWHDRGKAHATFQDAIKAEGRPPEWEASVRCRQSA